MLAVVESIIFGLLRHICREWKPEKNLLRRENGFMEQPNQLRNSRMERLPVRRLSRTARTTLSLTPPLSPSLSKKNTIVGIRAEYPQAFESIWVKYKRGDKRAALEEWNKLNLSELEIAMLSRSVDRYVQNTPELKFRMHLSRFLKTDWREVEPVLEAGNAEKPKWLQRVSSIESDSWDEGDASHG
jgi:hypothetical protein